MAAALCACGGKSDSQDGSTALIWAVCNGHKSCARLLIDTGAEKDIRDNVRDRPLLCLGRRNVHIFLSLLHFPSLLHTSAFSPASIVFGTFSLALLLRFLR